VFAPVVDVGLSASRGPYPQFDMVEASSRLGVKFFQLGYVTADENGEPIFAGYRLESPWDAGLRAQITALRQLGGDVSISFGGANGAESELARVITDVDELTKAYQWVIDSYGVNRVDFDIQGSSAGATASSKLRWSAVAALEKIQAAEGRPLDVWITIAARPSGLSADEINVVRSAVAADVDIAGVNLVLANFGDLEAPQPEGRMSQYSITAVQQAFDQLRDVLDPRRQSRDEEIWARLGVTPMVGQNDTRSERFYPSDGLQVLAFARKRGVGLLAIDSINRDANTGQANYDSSGIDQTAFEFTHIFAPYTDSGVAAR
jgi:hypothetical protein